MNKQTIWISALALSFSISQGVFACHGDGPDHKPLKHHLGQDFEKMVKKLDLTTEQEKKMHEIREQEKASMKPKMMELHDISMQLNDLAKASVVDEDKLNDLISKKQKIDGEITRIRIMTRHQMNMVLDEKQKGKMEEMTIKMREKIKDKMND